LGFFEGIEDCKDKNTYQRQRSKKYTHQKRIKKLSKTTVYCYQKYGIILIKFLYQNSIYFDMAKNIAYFRVSKKEENIENQREAIKKFANEDLIFFEDVISGSTKAEERKGFKEMLEYIEKMKPEKLYVYEISRLGRSMIETISVIQKLEKSLIVIPVSEKERWLATTDRSVRNLIMAIFSWVAEREREMLIERTKNGIERAKNEGKKLGRPSKEIDWKKVNEYRNKGISYSAISRILDIPYPTLIRKKNNIERR